MFCTTYNLKKFGNIVKKIRNNLNLSQMDVKKAINISTNTIRRLEKGETIPTYETIELLSILYKENLLEILQTCKSSPSLYDIYNQVDSAIINQNSEMIEQIQALIEKGRNISGEIELIDYSHYNQLMCFLDLIKDSTIYNDALNYDYIMKLENCIKISIPNFKISDLDQYNYNYIELRILLLIALIYKGNKNFKKSLEILTEIENNINNKINLSIDAIKILLKIICNISYMYYIIEEINMSLEYANKGINLCREYDTNYVLYFLYARKGIAKLLLGKEDYLKDIYNSICLLDVTEKFELKKIYIKTFKEQYDIDINF